MTLEPDLFPYGYSNKVYLRRDPPVVQCRAYEIKETAIKDIIGDLDASFKGDLRPFLTVRGAWETNNMVWINSRKILVVIGPPSYLDTYDRMMDGSEIGERYRPEP